MSCSLNAFLRANYLYSIKFLLCSRYGDLSCSFIFQLMKFMAIFSKNKTMILSRDLNGVTCLKQRKPQRSGTWNFPRGNSQNKLILWDSAYMYLYSYVNTSNKHLTTWVWSLAKTSLLALITACSLPFITIVKLWSLDKLISMETSMKKKYDIT